MGSALDRLDFLLPLPRPLALILVGEGGRLLIGMWKIESKRENVYVAEESIVSIV